MPISEALGDAFVEIRADLRRLSTDLADAKSLVNQQVRDIGAQTSTVGRRLSVGLTAPIVAIGALVTTLGIEFESSFAGVRKTVDASETELAALAQGFRDLATEIPINVNELNRIGEAAGQLGIQTGNILGFTDTVAKLGVTTDLAGDQAASALARIANITQLPQSDFDRLGATIVGLGNNFAATEAEIVDFGLRIAGAGQIAGLSQAQILGIGAAMSSVGVESEAGGTAVQKVLLSMVQAVTQGGDQLEAFAAAANMTSAEFAASFRDDAGAAFEAFVLGLGTQGQDAITTLEALGLQDQRLIRSFLSLASAGDLVTTAMRGATEEFAANTALTAEAAKRFGTTASQLQLLTNRFVEVALSLAGALLPVLHDVVGVVERLLPLIRGVVGVFTNLPQPLQTTIVIFGGLIAAIGPVLLVVGSLVTAVATIAPVFAAGTTGATILAGAISLLTGPIGLVVGAIAGLALAWAAWGEDVTQFVSETFLAIKEWLWDKLEPVLTPIIGLLQSIGRMFEAFFQLVSAIAVRIFEAISEMVQGIREALVTRLQPIFAPIGSAFEALGRVFGVVKDTILGIVRAIYEGVKLWLLDRFTGIVDGIRARVDQVTGFFGDMYEKVVGGSFVPDLIRGIEAEFAKLPTIMIGPTRSAASGVTGLFSGLMSNVNTLVGQGLSALGNTVSSGLSRLLGGGGIAGTIGSLVGSIIPGLGNILGGLVGTGIGKVADWVGGLFTGGEGAKTNDVRDAWMEQIFGPGGYDAWASWIGEMDQQVSGEVGSRFRDLFEQLYSADSREAFMAAASDFEALMAEVDATAQATADLETQAQEAARSVGDEFTAVGSTVDDVATEMRAIMARFAAGVADESDTSTQEAADAFQHLRAIIESEFLHLSDGFQIPIHLDLRPGAGSIQTPSLDLPIEWAGTGGIAMSPTIVGVGDVPEALIPLDRLDSLMVGRTGPANDRPIVMHIPVYVGGQKVDEHIVETSLRAIERNSGGGAAIGPRARLQTALGLT